MDTKYSEESMAEAIAFTRARFEQIAGHPYYGPDIVFLADASMQAFANYIETKKGQTPVTKPDPNQLAGARREGIQACIDALKEVK